MEGNQSELGPTRKSPWSHVNTPLEHRLGVKAPSDDFNTEFTWKSWNIMRKLI